MTRSPKRIESTVSTAMVRPFLRRLDHPMQVALAGQVELLSAEEGFQGPLTSADTRISHALAMRLLKLFVEQTGDAWLGLHAAEDADNDDFGVYGYLDFLSSTLGEAIESAIRYVRLCHDGVEMDLVTSGEQSRMRTRFVDGSCRELNDFIVAAAIVRGRRFSGLPLRPLGVRFMHPRPDDVSEYERFFGAPIEFGCTHNELLIPSAALDMVLPKVDTAAFAKIRRHADDLLAQSLRVTPFERRVREIVAQQMPLGAPTLRHAAGKLGMSERTVARRLHEDGTNYRALLEDTRRQLAVRYLKDEAIALREIALLLGFSRVAAFHHAFRRWYGVTPSEYRAT